MQTVDCLTGAVAGDLELGAKLLDRHRSDQLESIQDGALGGGEALGVPAFHALPPMP